MHNINEEKNQIKIVPLYSKRLGIQGHKYKQNNSIRQNSLFRGDSNGFCYSKTNMNSKQFNFGEKIVTKIYVIRVISSLENISK